MAVERWTIVTGATGAMGSAAVRDLVSRGRAVVMACRNTGAAEKKRQELMKEFPDARIMVRPLDLSLPASIRSFAEDMQSLSLESLFNNAGVMSRRFSTTERGYEWTMGVNYFGTALLSLLIAPQLPEGGHIVNMVSLSAWFVPFSRELLKIDERNFSQLGSYARSKLALILFTLRLAEEFPSLRVNMSDPGIVDTGMIRMQRFFDPLTDLIFRPFCNSPEKGVRPALRALDTQLSGHYFVGRHDRTVPSRYSRMTDTGWLWEETLALTGIS